MNTQEISRLEMKINKHIGSTTTRKSNKRENKRNGYKPKMGERKLDVEGRGCRRRNATRVMTLAKAMML